MLEEWFVHAREERGVRGWVTGEDSLYRRTGSGERENPAQLSPNFFRRLSSVLRAMPRARAASALLPLAAASARTRYSRSRRSRSQRSASIQEGWSAEARRRNLRFLAYNPRFLIVPWVQVPHLASHILGQMARRIAGDAHQDVVELRQPDQRRARQERAVHGHEQAVDVEDRQRVQQHVGRRLGVVQVAVVEQARRRRVAAVPASPILPRSLAPPRRSRWFDRCTVVVDAMRTAGSPLGTRVAGTSGPTG